MSRKGVSAEEKRNRMLQLFYEKKTFFQLKDLEKIAPKEKGIIANSVKDVIQQLVDEGKIDTDKIGTSVYFWSFPSKAKNNRKRKLQELTSKYEESTKKLKKTSEYVDNSKGGKEECDERKVLIDKITDLQIEKDELTKTLQKSHDNDPEIIERMKTHSQECKLAANRWTDNIFSLKSWCKTKFFMEDKVLDKQFGIPEDFDYIE